MAENLAELQKRFWRKELELPNEEGRRPLAGNKIRSLREQRSWTLKRLAREAGVPLNTAWRLEAGRGAVLANAVKVAGAFQLSVYEVWDIPGPRVIPWVTPAQEKRNNLRSLRLERQWTLDDLAQRSHVARSTIAQIERGQGPTLRNAVMIAAAFGVSVYEIWSIPSS
jgi:transcriptional regulator with XRE-family HTH domain